MQNRRDAEDTENRIWLALAIGNSRLHWAWFVGETLQQAWDTDHPLTAAVEHLAPHWHTQKWLTKILPHSHHPNSLCAFAPLREQNSKLTLPLYLASVVPSQTALWQTYPNVHIITIDQLPLQGLYPTLGIDRALALWGAGETWGWPMLTIDAGTALTFTGADAERRLVGGAILPGLGLQVKFFSPRNSCITACKHTRFAPSKMGFKHPNSDSKRYSLHAGCWG